MLKQDLILRPQRHNEPLSIYIEEVKINAQVLMCEYSESQLVNFIKNGISPDIRNKLTFEANPHFTLRTFTLRSIKKRENRLCYDMTQ